jgi:predicted metal-dependent hydrolase
MEKIDLILGKKISINIKRVLKLKSISIKICKNYIYIKVPFFLSQKKIEQLIRKKKNWIKKQLLNKSKTKDLKIKEYVNNENFLYLGKKYKLKLIINKKYSVNITNDYLVISVKNELNTTKIKSFFKKWLLERSADFFKEQTYYFAKNNNLNVNSVKIREYKARWGSCSNKGDISFNWRLIMAPPKIIEYVIIHELMHLKVHNHSPKYWKHVNSLYPNVKDAKEWLMHNGQTLNI